MTNPWAGRFAKGMDESVKAFSASIAVDRRLYREDIAGSIAHAEMLAAQGIISSADSERIVAGLRAVQDEIERGVFPFRDDLEDIHMNIETRLAALIGEVAGRLHTARSRNDQVATDLRLWLRSAIDDTIDGVAALIATLLDQAEAAGDVYLPGYTHLQRAQPVPFAHHLLAYVEMLRRDVGRFWDARVRVNVLPLGSGALAGAPYPLDRHRVAADLGFAEVSRNSLDAVADRDFAIEYAAAAALLMAHLSRFAEDVILWTSAEFGFVSLDDAFATGSSIMPQKKNPDVAELTRGKTGRVYGHLMALLTLVKGLPLSYNRDLQEDKPALFDSVDTVLLTLQVFRGMVATWTIRPDRMAAAVTDESLATDYADYLVRKGLPFREAHYVVGRLVAKSEQSGRSLKQLTLDELRAESSLYDEDVLAITPRVSMDLRDLPGGAAPRRLPSAIAEAREWLATVTTRHRAQ